MKQNATRDGLSARQKTIIHSRFLFTLMLLLSLSACHEKTNGQEQAETKPTITVPDNTHKPDVKIQVNKRYDDKGNLIGFDSLYSSYYSSVPDDTLDSLHHGFEAYFSQKHSAFFNNRMNSLFFSDTLSYPDFFHDDFFQQHLRLNDAYMKDMMRQMDSIKNAYYHERAGVKRKQLPKGKTL